MTTVSGPSGKLDRRGRSRPNLPTTSEAGLAGLKSNVRHTDAYRTVLLRILKSAFKKASQRRSPPFAVRHCCYLRYEGPTRTLTAPDLFGQTDGLVKTEFSGLAYGANALRSHRSAWPGRDDPVGSKNSSEA